MFRDIASGVAGFCGNDGAQRCAAIAPLTAAHAGACQRLYAIYILTFAAPDFGTDRRKADIFAPAHHRGVRQSPHLIGAGGWKRTGQTFGKGTHPGLIYPVQGDDAHGAEYAWVGQCGDTPHGGNVVETGPVTALQRDGARWQLTTPRGALSARNVIVATGAYAGQVTPKPLRYFSRRIIPVGSFIIVSRPLSDAEIAATVPGNRTYVTSLNVGQYFRLSPDNRLIFGGRARFSSKSDATSDAVSARILRQGMTQMFPALAGVEIDYCYGGLVDMTQDRLPRAGCVDGLYYAMGYSGHGAQMSNLMGVTLADMIMGKTANPLADLLWPAIPMYSGRPWFLPAVGAYYRFKDLIS